MMKLGAILVVVAMLLACGNKQQPEQKSVGLEPATEQVAPASLDALEFTKRCLTPQAQLHGLESLTLDVVKELDALGITYWLDSGTLIGAYRFHSHMPFDDDADLGVLKKELDDQMDALIVRLSVYGHSIRNLGDEYHWQITSGRDSHVFLDLFPFEEFAEHENYLRLSGSYWHAAARHAGLEGLGFPRKVIFDAQGNLGKVKMLGVELSVPFDIKAYLARWYAEDDILTNFVISTPHGQNYCKQFVKISDIRKEPKVLEVMLDHLEMIFGDRFKRSEVRF